MMLLKRGEISETVYVKRLGITIDSTISIEKISEELILMKHFDKSNGLTYEKMLNIANKNLSIVRVIKMIDKLKK